MAQMSDYLENAIANGVFRNTPYIPSTTVYVALYSTDPTDADTGTELSGGAYLRVAASFGAPTDGTIMNDADISFPVATADWAAVTHIGIRDNSSGGNLLMHQALATPVTVASGNNFRIPAGQLILTFA